MATMQEHTQQLRVKNTQMEMPQTLPTGRPDDYESKLRLAEEELERNRLQLEEIARKKQELEELKIRKHQFIGTQAETCDKLTNAITLIERSIVDVRNELEDLEQCRICFSAHLDKIEKINPEAWSRDNILDKLQRATVSIDMALDEFDQAANHFAGSRIGTVFGRPEKSSKSKSSVFSGNEFLSNLSNGFAFNLPLLILGSLALIVYLIK